MNRSFVCPQSFCIRAVGIPAPNPRTTPTWQ